MAAEIKVKEYNNPAQYQGDARHMAGQGWSVKDTSERVQRRGCISMILFGWNLGLIFPPVLVRTPTRPARRSPAA